MASAAARVVGDPVDFASPIAQAAAVVAAHFDLSSDLVIKIYRDFTYVLMRERRTEHSERRRRIVEEAREKARDGKPTASRQENEAFDRVEAFDNGRRVEAYRARDPVDQYAKQRRITPRQADAGRRFREDWELGIVGAHDPEAGRGSGGSLGGFTDAQLMAAENYAAVVERLGTAFRPIVERVVLAGEWIDDIAERRADQDVSARLAGERLFWQLRSGLDILGDAYGAPAELIAETIVVSDELSVRVCYRHEADGSISAVRHSGVAWSCSVASLGELRAEATKLRLFRGKFLRPVIEPAEGAVLA